MALFSSQQGCLSLAASTVAGLLLVLGSAHRQIHANPLVYPNRFSFQKTTSTSSTPIPILDHDHSNNSISSSLGNAIANESGISSDRTFRYDIAAWVIGSLIFICFLIVLLYPRKKNSRSEVPSCYMFPSDSDLKADADSDSAKIISGQSTEDNT